MNSKLLRSKSMSHESWKEKVYNLKAKLIAKVQEYMKAFRDSKNPKQTDVQLIVNEVKVDQMK